ncbi:integral membrane protein [Colletotrichum kahawae]|uniref:Integral membrane protein n=1 Tax=Colletotrichum kahawae TaxID=34407 RepID=A0AAE0CXZ2_COLKA|nr:integral membrane protein [Colletotrichum kahawae]
MVAGPAVSAFVTSIVFTSLSFIVVALRLYTRIVVVGNVGVDDYLIPAALAASIGFSVVVMHQIKFGLGMPMATITPDNLVRFLQCLWATIPTYNLALLFCKLSIIFSYLRVLKVATTQKICKAMLVVLAVYGAWTVFGSIFMCVPVQAFWGDGTGRCMDRLAFWFSNAALNIATDIIIVAIPIPLIRTLQISRKQKIALIMVFAVGGFVCITSIIRLRSLYEISISPDTSRDGVHIATWSGIEINVAIICASAPALKPLIAKAFPKLLASTQRSNMRSGQLYGRTTVGESHHMQSMKSRTGKKPSQNIAIETKIEVMSHNGSQMDLVRTGGNTMVAECYSTEERPPAQGRSMV